MPDEPVADSIAALYHRQTMYFPENVGRLLPNLEDRPPTFKDYVSDRAIDLKPYLEGVFDERDSLTTDPETIESHANRSRLSRLLFHTGGITGVLETDDGPHYFRAWPSAGALYPTEIYLATEGMLGVPDGIHFYSVRNHEIVPLWEGEFLSELRSFCFDHPAASRSRTFLILTGIYRRSSWRYLERAYRRILLDTGHLLGNFVEYAPVEGLHVSVLPGFHDEAVNNLLFLDTDQEVSLVVAALHEDGASPDRTIETPFPLAASPPGNGGSRGSETGEARSVMRLLHHSSSIVPDTKLAPSRPPGAAAPLRFRTLCDVSGPIVVHTSGTGSLQNTARTIRMRRSTRRFRRAHLTVQDLGAILRHAYEPTLPYLEAQVEIRAQNAVLADPSLLATFVVSLRVDGLPPGVYQLHPRRPSFHLLKEGLFESELCRVCLDQELGRDCAAAVVHTANLAVAIRRYGNRAYRYIHLDAGHLGQRMNLAAVERGVGVSGIGGFFDREVNQLLDLPEEFITAYITVLGRDWAG